MAGGRGAGKFPCRGSFPPIREGEGMEGMGDKLVGGEGEKKGTGTVLLGG